MWYHYLWWVPATAFWYGVLAWLSKQSNELQGYWTWSVWGWGALCPLWAVVSRISGNVILDGVLYDAVLIISQTVVWIHLGLMGGSKIPQWTGLFMIILGSILMRVELK